MKISVVIPLFNKGATIERALASVLSQSRPADEIIVVDDGSTDSGPEKVKNLAGSRIAVIRQENLGVSAARNRGITAAIGDYVAFLDADDYWLDHHLQWIEFLVTSQPNAVMFATRSTGAIDSEPYVGTPRLELGSVYSGDFLDFFVDDHSIINSSTACVRRESMLQVSGFPEGVGRGEDIVTWLRVGEVGEFAGANAISAVYDRHVQGSASSMPLREVPESLLYIAEQSGRRDLSRRWRSSHRKLYRRLALSTVAVSRLNGNNGDLLVILRHAARRHQWSTAIGLVMVGVTPRRVLTWMRMRTARSR